MDAQSINDIAVAWVVRLDRDDPEAEQQDELDSWLALDPRHRGAFARAQAAWLLLDRARALAPSAPIETGFGRDDRWTECVQPIATRRPRGPSRRLMLGGGIAASIAAGLLLAPRRASSIYQTGQGEIRRVLLSDGSSALIDAESRLEASMSAKLRQVDLLRGQAVFYVAKDQERPFMVRSGRAEVQAAQATFAVSRQNAEATEVLVADGAVQIELASWNASPMPLRQGSRAVIEDRGRIDVAALPMDDIYRKLAWKDGQIALSGQTLSEAVAEFNRYNMRQLVIEGPGLADLRLVGWFRIDDPEGFAKAVEITLGAKVRIGDRAIVLSAR